MQKLTLKEMLDLIEPITAVLINADTYDNEGDHQTVPCGPFMANDIANRLKPLFDWDLYNRPVQRIFPAEYRGRIVLVVEVEYFIDNKEEQ